MTRKTKTPKPERVDALSPEILEQVRALVARGALFVSNNSGGKDSQAMLITLSRIVPREQLLSLHATLGEDGEHDDGVEWPDTLKWVRYMSEALGVRVAVCGAKKSLFDMVARSAQRLREQGRYETSSPWPSPQTRQCTSDLKRGPIKAAINRHINEHGLSGIVVNCMGLRYDESPKRAKATVWQRKPEHETQRGAVREWYEWLPIHHFTTEQVFDTITAAGQKCHWAYDSGMTRLSCCFCIMASEADLVNAAKLRPALYERYVRTERELGKTMAMDGRSLEQVTGVRVSLKVVA